MKYVMLNKEGTIIDIVDMVKPVKKSRSGVTVLCPPEEAQGYVGSDNETVYAKMGTQLLPSYYDILTICMVDEVPENVSPLEYKYSTIEGFIPNDSDYPDTNTNLTKKTKVNEEDISDVRKGTIENYEATASNSNDIEELREAMMELYENL